MRMRPTIRVKGSRELKTRLQVVARRIKNSRPANRKLSVWLDRWVDENFRTEGGKLPRKWKPLKAGGRWVKRGNWLYWDPSAKILQDTRVMYRSLRPFYGKDFAGIGSDLPRSVWHNFGVPENNLPARRIIPLNTDKEVVTAARKIYDTYVRKALR